jgi:hypothetical protein
MARRIILDQGEPWGNLSSKRMARYEGVMIPESAVYIVVFHQSPCTNRLIDSRNGTGWEKHVVHRGVFTQFAIVRIGVRDYIRGRKLICGNGWHCAHVTSLPILNVP